jgi:TolB-like protein/predicted Ser/Thr protein kinase
MHSYFAGDGMIGESISHYRILEKLGEGGMGVVYKAEDTKLKRTVALKFLSGRAVAGDEERVRFQREAEAAAALSHPNICTVHEIDEFEGRPFIAMEFVDGQTLKQMIAAGPLKLDAALATALQVAEGLQEAHGAGIVHRDIKPANVMVAGEGRVKIMDFGLATSQAATRVTQKGTTIGTVAYMSPEQARGGEVDHRTDIWSFGAMLYEMVSGRLPFKGDSEQAVIYSIFNDEPQPLTGLRTGVPVDLERIAGKCLAKDPGERYQTATDLLADLRRLQRVSASGAPPPGPAVSRSGTEPRARHWSRGATLAAILVVIVALAPGILRRYFPTSGERSAAERAMLVVLPFDNLGAPEDEYFADGITEEITSRLATLHELGVISRTSAVTYKNTSKTIKQIGQELQVDYVLEGTVRWDRSGDGISRVRVTPQLIRVADDTHLWSERYDRELQNVFGIQSDVSEQVVQQLGIALLKPARLALQARPTENLAAYQAYLKGLDYSQQEMYSEENWRLVIQMFERAVELDPAFAVAYVELSEAHSEMVNLGFDRTPERVEMAKAAVDEALRLQPDLPDAHLALGYYYYWCLHEYDKALAAFGVAAERLPSESAILAATAWIKRRQGHWRESLDLAERAFALSPRDAALARELGHGPLPTGCRVLRPFHRARSGPAGGLRPEGRELLERVGGCRASAGGPGGNARRGYRVRNLLLALSGDARARLPGRPGSPLILPFRDFRVAR